MSESLANLERLLANQEVTFGRHNLEIGKTLTKIAKTAVDLRDYSKAETSLWRALDIFRKVYGEQHVDVLFCIEQLADIAEAQCDDIQAARLRQQAAQIKEKPMTKDALPPRTKAWSTPLSKPAPSVTPAPVVPPSHPQPPKPSAPAPSLSQTEPPTAPPQFAPPCSHGFHPAECPLCLAVRSVAKDKVPTASPLDVNQSTGNSPSLTIVVKTTGEKVTLGPNKMWIGRAQMNDISLPDDGDVLPCHAMIECLDGEYWIRPCAEDNRLAVNGSAITSRAALRSGDVIKIGSSELRVQ